MSSSVAALAEAPSPSRRAWPLARKLALRFACAYYALWALPFPLDRLPFVGDAVSAGGDAVWHRLVPFIGKHVLHLPHDITIFTTGSGDTTYDWLKQLVVVVLALLATLVWSLLDRRREHYDRLWQWLRVYLRFYLAAVMLGYGFHKVFKLQFGMPGPGKLLEPLGEMSPQGLLWTFMGFSTAYTIFAGAAEVLGGTLLLWRRTTTLGALVIAAVMTNVVMLNFCYDVDVKLFSANLLLIALVLAAPDAKLLLDVLVWRRPVAPRPSAALFPTGRRRWVGLAVKALFITQAYYQEVSQSIAALAMYGDHAPPIAMFGAFDVEELSPAESEPARRWRRVSCTNFRMALTTEDGETRQFSFNDDKKAQTMTLQRFPEGDQPAVLHYVVLDEQHRLLSGTFDGHEVRARLRKLDVSKSRLMTRGFHFIQEYPYTY
jgi:uncharacterized membrane protein YphA (DoxX/SURF4 family)